MRSDNCSRRSEVPLAEFKPGTWEDIAEVVLGSNSGVCRMIVGRCMGFAWGSHAPPGFTVFLLLQSRLDRETPDKDIITRLRTALSDQD